MKHNHLLPFLLSLLFSFTTMAQEKKNPTPNKTLVIQEKNPAAAFLYAAVMPGVGRMYNGEVGSGLGIFFLEGVLTGVGYELISYTEVDQHYYYAATTYPYKNVGTVCLYSAGLIYLMQLIEAPLRSAEINRQRGFVANSIQFEIKPIPHSNHLSVGMRYTF